MKCSEIVPTYLTKPEKAEFKKFCESKGRPMAYILREMIRELLKKEK